MSALSASGRLPLANLYQSDALMGTDLYSKLEGGDGIGLASASFCRIARVAVEVAFSPSSVFFDLVENEARDAVVTLLQVAAATRRQLRVGIGSTSEKIGNDSR